MEILVQLNLEQRTCAAANELGNALGSSLAEASSSPSYSVEEMAGDYQRENNRFAAAAAANGGGASGSWGGMDPIDYSLANGGRVRFGTGSVESQPTAEELQAAFRQSERDYRGASEQSVAGSGYVARGGDSISRIVGSSDPQAIGNFMRANGLTSDRIEAGRNYFRPDSTTAYGDASDLGQFALNQGNERIADANRSETQRELNRFAAMTEASGAAPVWNMRDASAAARLQAQRDYEARLASLPGQSMSSWDGVLREAPAVEYLNRSYGGMGAVRGEQMQFQVAQQLPDAMLTVGAPELIPARVTALLGRGAEATQGLLFGERSVLMSNLQAEMRVGLRADLPALASMDGLAPASLGWPGRGGAGPVPGTIGITDSTSVAALQNYYPKGGGVEFVYDPTTNRFVAGSPMRGLFDGSPHEQLAQSIGAADNPAVVGGTFQRGANGEFFTTENSGHYGKNWNNEVRAQFQQWLSNRVDRPVVHETWRP